MPTVAQLVSDVELQTYQGSISDDVTLSKSQLKFWLSYHLNQLVANEINEKLKRGEEVPSLYIRQVTCDVLDTEDNSILEACAYRVYTELENPVLTINNDGGIIRVEDEDGNEIKKAGVRSLGLFKNMRFSKPSADNVLYSHEGASIVYFPGLKPADVDFENFIVWYVPQQDLTTMSETDEVLVSDLVLPQLINEVVTRARLEIYGTEQDQENDGISTPKNNYHTSIRNPE